MKIKQPQFEIRFFLKHLRKMRGWYIAHPNKKDIIEISVNLSEKEKISTLFHEFSHFLLQSYNDLIKSSGKNKTTNAIPFAPKKCYISDSDQEKLCREVEDAATVAFYSALERYRKFIK